MIQQIVDLVTFRAFAPEPKDWREPVARRFPGKKVLVLQMGYKSYRVSLAKISRKGAIDILKGEEFAFREIGAETKVLMDWATRNKVRHCVVITAGGWEPIRCKTTYHEKSFERAKLLREDPEKVFTPPSRLDRNKRYTFVAHPEFEHGIALGLAPERIDEAIKMVETKTPLKVVRATVGIFVLLDDVADDQYAKLPENGWLFLADINGILIVKIEDREWVDVGYRAKKAETTGDDAITAILNRMDADADFAVADGSDFSIAATIEAWQRDNGHEARVTEVFPTRGSELVAICALDD